MTTGEKILLFRKKQNITQEQMAQILNVSRQAVSRWEMDQAFPETEKLIKLSRLLECSIDYLLNDELEEQEQRYLDISVDDCCKFIHECGYFFVATSINEKPRLRPFGMIYSNGNNLYIVSDKRKSVYSDLEKNSKIELASYNSCTRKWIRISGNAQVESSSLIKDEICAIYPMLNQKFKSEQESFLVIFKLQIDNIQIN